MNTIVTNPTRQKVEISVEQYAYLVSCEAKSMLLREMHQDLKKMTMQMTENMFAYCAKAIESNKL